MKVWGIAPDGTELISGADAQAIITLLSSEINAITKHNHALAAQVEALRVAIEPFSIGGVCSAIAREDYSIMHERIKDWHGVNEFKKAQAAYDATPRQHLAQIRAEAGRAGFIEGCELIIDLVSDGSNTGAYKFHADEYAAKVRQGGEK